MWLKLSKQEIYICKLQLCSNFGLKYRTLDHTVTDEISGSGRTFSGKDFSFTILCSCERHSFYDMIGIATKFIQYPTSYIIFEFSDSKDADVSYCLFSSQPPPQPSSHIRVPS